MRVSTVRGVLGRVRISSFVRGQKGQTLAEVLVALVILGIAGVALLGGLTFSYHMAVLHDEKTMAESLTRSELERIRYAAYPISDNTTSKFDGRFLVTVDAEYVIPTINDTVQPYTTDYVVSATPQTMQLVTVTVTNRDGKSLLVTTTNKVSR